MVFDSIGALYHISKTRKSREISGRCHPTGTQMVLLCVCAPGERHFKSDHTAESPPLM